MGMIVTSLCLISSLQGHCWHVCKGSQVIYQVVNLVVSDSTVCCWLAGMIRRLLLLEKQLMLSRRSNNMRHNSSHKNHCRSKSVTNDLESTTEGLKRGLNFAHRLLGQHHVRTGRRHKATKGSLSLLKRQQVKARRQRLAFKKQLQRALAQQSLLQRQMERLQQILDAVLQVSTDCTVTHVLRQLLCVYVVILLCALLLCVLVTVLTVHASLLLSHLHEQAPARNNAALVNSSLDLVTHVLVCTCVYCILRACACVHYP